MPEKLILEDFAYMGDLAKGFLESKRDAATTVLHAVGARYRVELVDGDPDQPPEIIGKTKFAPNFSNGMRWRLRIWQVL